MTDPSTINVALLNFYVRDGKDDKGRTLKQFLSWDDNQLERSHDVIQWLLPTKTPSRFNPAAPILDDQTAKQLVSYHDFTDNFTNVLERLFEFWNVAYETDDHREKVVVLGVRRAFWQTEGNHNMLRFSRLMESCRLLDRPETGESFFYHLCRYGLVCEAISKDNIFHWWEALTEFTP